MNAVLALSKEDAMAIYKYSALGDMPTFPKYEKYIKSLVLFIGKRQIVLGYT